MSQLNIEDKKYALRLYYSLLINFGEIKINVGLCLASGFNELVKLIGKLFQNNKAPINESST